jgi:hypothetical protein
MSEFSLYFKLGMHHILDINGFDHILFVIALCAIYLLRDWKKVLILVTAFTIGHSLTLALSTFNLINVNTDLVEFLIPTSILFTTLINIFRSPNVSSPQYLRINYFLALFFGLIHGMGFSNYLKGILGKNTNVAEQLLAFNLGLEFGQLIIVVTVLFLSYIFIGIFSVSRRDWNMVISSAIAGIAILLIIQAKFW